MNDNKLAYILAGVVGLLAVVAIIISAIALVQNQSPSVTINQNQPSSGGMAGGYPGGGYVGGQEAGISGGSIGNFPMATAGRIYSLAIGHDYVSHEYFDNEGYLTGFGINLIDRVCSEASIDCRVVWDQYANCWDSKVAQHAVGGRGLHDKWYDGCTGWYTTIGRSHVFTFSQPYLKEPLTYFYVLPGKNLDTSRSNLENSKIVYLDSWASDEKCMTRQTGAIMDASKIVYAPSTEKAIALLKSYQYQALFTTEATMRPFINDGTVKQIGSSYSCMMAGNAIMTRKDSDLPEQWNRGFNKLRNTGAFKKFCTEQNDIHKAKGHVECVDSY